MTMFLHGTQLHPNAAACSINDISDACLVRIDEDSHQNLSRLSQLDSLQTWSHHSKLCVTPVHKSILALFASACMRKLAKGSLKMGFPR